MGKFAWCRFGSSAASLARRNCRRWSNWVNCKVKPREIQHLTFFALAYKVTEKQHLLLGHALLLSLCLGRNSLPICKRKGERGVGRGSSILFRFAGEIGGAEEPALCLQIVNGKKLTDDNTTMQGLDSEDFYISHYLQPKIACLAHRYRACHQTHLWLGFVAYFSLSLSTFSTSPSIAIELAELVSLRYCGLL